MKVEFKKVKLKDAIKLKTYKIKNHDSGKTYNVKAKSFNDAKDKYNKMIVNDGKLVEVSEKYLSKFVSEIEKIGFKVDNKGKTWSGGIHYQIITKTGNNDEFTLKKMAQALSKISKLFYETYNIPVTYNVGLQTDGYISAGVDLRQQYVKDSFKIDDEITNIVKQVKSKFDVSATFKSDKNSQTLEITEWKENDTAKLKQYINQQLSNIDNFNKKGTNENDSLVWSWKKENVKDALTEDEWQYVHYKSKEERELRNLCSKHNVKFGPYVLDKDGFYKARIEGDFDDVHKVNNLWKNYQFNGVLEDSITEDANYEEGFSSTKGELALVVHESIAQHLKRKFGGYTSSQKVYGQKQSYWTTTNKSVYEAAKKYLSNGFKDSVEDAATNDSHYLESNKQYMTKLWNKKDVFERKYKVAITRQGEGHYIEGSRKNLVSLLQELRGSDFNANPFIHDSITEDALSKFVQSYLSSKKPKTKTEQDEIIKFLLERNKITKEDIPKVRTLLKIVKDSHPLKTYKIKNNDSGKTYKVKAVSYTDAVKKYNKHILKDSLTEDTNITVNTWNAFIDKHYNSSNHWDYAYIGDIDNVNNNDDFSRQEEKELQRKYKYFLLSTRGEYSFFTSESSALQAVKKSWPDIVNAINKQTKDSINDADIAQTDIKSSYLPEDANAENIKYLGFNELRKISFYQYGDNFYAHYDLTGAVEKIDKDAVQRILKKNIIGEIDEDILTQKQSKNEEIVSDARDFKSGDIVHLKGYPANAELELVSRNSKGAWEAKPIPGSSLQKTYYLMSEYFDSTVADKLIGNGEVHFRYKGGRVITGAWNKNKLNEREISSILNKYNCKREQERWNDIVFSTRIGNEENLCKAFNEINPSYSVSELLSFHDSKERGDK